MPSKSSASTDSSATPKRKTTRQKSASKTEEKTTTRKKAVKKKDVVADDDLDFGAGIVDDDRSSSSEAKAEKPAKPKKRKKAVKPEATAEPLAAEASKPARTEDAPKREKKAPVADVQPVEISDSRPSDQEPGDSEEKPKRRRRRRRRKGGSGNTEGTQPTNNGMQQRKKKQHGGKNRRNTQQQQRKPAKFEKNAAPPSPVQTSGEIEGVLELHPKGYGFLRSASNDYGARETDPFVSSSFVEKHHLREGIKIVAEIGPGTRGQGPRLLEIKSIDGGPVEDYEARKHFDNLTPINPFEQIKLETGTQPTTMRVMDLLTPIGKGQRALIVAPPRTGKTMLLHDIAHAVSTNHPEIHLIVLLIDERPEEVTEMRRTVHGEVIASSMDEDVESHVRISQLIFERGKRLAEAGKDCLILMDSVTRTARAFNKWMSGGRDSKIATGGLDVRALDIPRKLFGTARRFDEGGSLTVIATALIETGSRMDESIFQEFKGTGNMEMVLSRDLADRRIWPSIDISRSGTRREEKILDPEILEGVTMLRRSLVSMNPVEAMDQLIRTLGKFETNREFLAKIKSVL